MGISVSLVASAAFLGLLGTHLVVLGSKCLAVGIERGLSLRLGLFLLVPGLLGALEAGVVWPVRLGQIVFAFVDDLR